MKRTQRLFAGLLLLSSFTLFGCPSVQPGPVTSAATLEDWQARRFGMFVHWGPVAQKGTEIGWSRGRKVPTAEYDELYKSFDPQAFDADAWAAVAKEAGMEYLVITAKHHDGFCLWPSDFTNYDIASTPYKKDILAQLSKACRDQDLMFGCYYSLCDWRHPDYPLDSPGGTKAKPIHDMARYFEFVKDQTSELLADYGPLGLLWFDGEWEKPWTDVYGEELYAALKVLQPGLLINNRVGKGRQGMRGVTSDVATVPGDFDTPEQQVGKFQRERPWESCITLCRQWAWKPNDKMKSLEQCIRTLVQVIGGDGNLLLNVGPMPDGRIEPRQVKRLQEMGAWVRGHSEAIHGTRGGPFEPGAWGASTCKGRKIYVFVTGWPADGPLVLPQIPAQIVSARLMDGGRVLARHEAQRLFIRVAAEDRQPIATVVEVTVDQQAFELPPR